MPIPVQVTFRHVPHSEVIEQLVRERAEQLLAMSDRITRCRVVIEEPHRRMVQGNLFRVSIDLRLPGAEIVVDRSPDQHAEHQDLAIAVRDAFDHAERELDKLVAKRRVAARRAAL